MLIIWILIGGCGLVLDGSGNAENAESAGAPRVLEDPAKDGGALPMDGTNAPELPPPDAVDQDLGGISSQNLLPLGFTNAFSWPTGPLTSLRGDDVSEPEIVFYTDTGRIEAVEESGAVRVIRDEGSGDIGGFVSQEAALENGESMLVFIMQDLILDRGKRIRAQGARPLILLLRGSAEIDGVFSVSATQDGPGPGGYLGGTTSSAGSGPGGGGAGLLSAEPPFLSGGGAGGSFGGKGGDGSALILELAGVAKPTHGSPELFPLIGGSGGGGASSAAGSAGGHGGGAVHIVSRSQIRVGEEGVIEAGGSGGSGGVASLSGFAAGSGGGSGGAILLEAPVIQIEGLLGVPGGSGGQGSPGANVDGQDGRDGDSRVEFANGPSPEGDGDGGGAGSGLSGTGRSPQSGRPHGGGGGGGAGRIHLRHIEAPPDLEDHTSPASARSMVTTGDAQVVP